MMPLVLFYTKRVRDMLKAPTGFISDLIFLLFAASIVGMLIVMIRHAALPLEAKSDISLSLWILPKYTLMSLFRGFAAYAISLGFTLVYATFAARNDPRS